MDDAGWRFHNISILTHCPHEFCKSLVCMIVLARNRFHPGILNWLENTCPHDAAALAVPVEISAMVVGQHVFSLESTNP